MKIIINFAQWKNVSVDVTIMSAIMHKQHFTQDGHSTWSAAVDIFNALRKFAQEPIREQEIKLECMNFDKWGVILKLRESCNTSNKKFRIDLQSPHSDILMHHIMFHASLDFDSSLVSGIGNM